LATTVTSDTMSMTCFPLNPQDHRYVTVPNRKFKPFWPTSKKHF